MTNKKQIVVMLLFAWIMLLSSTYIIYALEETTNDIKMKEDLEKTQQETEQTKKCMESNNKAEGCDDDTSGNVADEISNLFK